MMKISLWEKSTLLGAMIAAITASLCCIIPLILLTIGIGGTWVSTFAHVGFLRPVGIVLTFVFLSLAFWKLHITPRRCAINKPCIAPTTLRIQRIIFWIVTTILLLLLAFPWCACLL